MKPEVRTASVLGTHYIQHSILLGKTVIHSQVQPYTDAEIAWRVAEHAKPKPPPRDYKALFISQKGRPGPKQKGKAANSGWKTDEVDE